MCVCVTHSFGVDGMHSKDECCDEGQVTVLKNTAFTGVHEQAGHSAVQQQIGDVEIERRHAMEQDVQPGGQKGTQRKIETHTSVKFRQRFPVKSNESSTLTKRSINVCSLQEQIYHTRTIKTHE